jgi:hypothetical protein
MSEANLQTLIDQAKPLIEAAITIDEEKARAAGELLSKIKKERPKGSWDQFVKMHFQIGQQWADRMIRIYEGKVTLAEDRGKNKERNARKRASDKRKIGAAARQRSNGVKISDFDSASAVPAPTRHSDEDGHRPPEGTEDQLRRHFDELIAAYKAGLREPARRAVDAMSAIVASMENPPLSVDTQESAATIATSH